MHKNDFIQQCSASSTQNAGSQNRQNQDACSIPSFSFVDDEEEFFGQLILTCLGNIIENPLSCMYNYKRHRCFLNDRRSNMVLQRE